MMGSHTPAVGTKVMTADGDELGTVKEVSGACFKVDAPMQPDYWLGEDSIASRTGASVSLRFSKASLGETSLEEQKQDRPGHTGYHRHNN